MGYLALILAAAVILGAAALAVCGCLYVGEHLRIGGGNVEIAGETEEEKTPEEAEKAPAEEEKVPEEYVFGEPVEESGRVEDDRFDGAVFLGDSRTEGLELFGGLSHGDFYWHRGLSVFAADGEEHRYFDVGGEKLTLLEALGAKSYCAVYLMLGVNELGYPPESYERALGELVERIVEAQPEAVVYLQTMPPVNDRAATENGLPEYECCENVDRFNEIIVKTAEEKRVALLDTASCYRGEDGQLPEELTRDGVHFSFDGYTRWAEYLRTHVIDPERYFYWRDAK